MKKKILPFLFSLCLLSGCGETEVKQPEEHTHSYGEWRVTKEATCKEAGLKERKCTGCENTETEEVAKLSTHSFGSWNETAATCKNDGKKERICSVCGQKETEVLTKLTTHTFGEWQETPATCIADGKKERFCSICGTKEFETLSKTDTHAYVDAQDQTNAVTPTCKDTGIVITECSVCGAKSTRVADKTNNHVWGKWSETTPATHSSKGVETRTCNVCNSVETRDIERTPGHIFGDTPVETFNGDYDLAPYEIYNCEADNAKKIVWSATSFTPDTLYKMYNDEPNIKYENGIQLGGRPINNAVEINTTGWGGSTAPKLDTNVPGSFIEYNINVKTAISNVTLSALLTPNTCHGGLFLKDEYDRYPGLFPDSTSSTGYRIADFRYIVRVNDVDIELDASRNIATEDAQEKGWYDFPCTFDLKTGINSIKIIQSGGYQSTFHKFALTSADTVEEVIPEPSEGFKVILQPDQHIKSLTVYADEKCYYRDSGTEVDGTITFYSRNKDGRKIKDGEGVTMFSVETVEGFKVKEVRQISLGAKAYEAVQTPFETSSLTDRDGVYRITKITNDVTFAILTEEIDFM